MVLLVHGIIKAGQETQSNSEAEVIGAGRIAAIASPIQGDVEKLFADPEEVAKLAVKHNEILTLWANDADVLPLRLGTLYSDENGVQALLLSEEERFIAGLEQVSGAVEMGVRITVAKPLLEKGDQTSAPITGRAYLKQRAGAKKQNRLSMEERHAFLESAVKKLLIQSRSHQSLPAKKQVDANGVTRLYDGAFLVPRETLQPFTQALSALEGDARSLGLSVSQNGPWPAYNFVPEAA